jgi:hypothetical protein
MPDYDDLEGDREGSRNSKDSSAREQRCPGGECLLVQRREPSNASNTRIDTARL